MSPALLTVYCGLLLTAGAFSNDILLPSMFAIQRDLATPIETVQLVVPVFMAVSSLGQLAFGPASDRFGRRHAIIAGLACYLLGSTIAILAGSIAVLLIGRALQGFGSACCQVVSRAILRDTHQGPQLAHAMAFATAIFSFGPIGAPLIGILLLDLGNWRSVFGAMIGFGLMMLALSVFAFEETNKHPDPRALEPRRLLAAFARVARHPQSRFFLLTASLLFFGIVSYVANSPRLFKTTFGIEGLPFAMLFATSGVGIMIGQLVNRRVIARFGVIASTQGATVLMAVISVLLLVLATMGGLRWWSFTALLFCFNASFLVVFSNSASLVIDPHKEIAGLAASAFGCVTQLCGSLLMLLTLPFMRGDLVIWSSCLAIVTVAVSAAVLRYKPHTDETCASQAKI